MINNTEKTNNGGFLKGGILGYSIFDGNFLNTKTAKKTVNISPKTIDYYLKTINCDSKIMTEEVNNQ